MSVASDSKLSAAAQQRIKELTAAATAGTVDWKTANQQANQIRASEGSAGYTPESWKSPAVTGAVAGTVGSVIGNQGGTQESAWKAPAGYTENIAADSVLSKENLAKIQSYRELAKTGSISWDQANQMANEIRSSAGYSVDKTGASTPVQKTYKTYQDFLEDMGYGDYTAQTQAAIQAAVEQAVGSYNDQIDRTNTDSAELARQAYVAKMLGQKNLDQKLSASGYAGGMADTQRLQTEVNYENNLNSIELQRADTVKELKSAIARAQLSGNQQLAEQLSAYLQSVQSQWSSYVQNQGALAANQAQVAAETAAAEKETAYTRSMELLSAGAMPSPEMLSAAGINETQAYAIRNYYAGGKKVSAGSTGSTGAGSGSGGGGEGDGGSGAITSYAQLGTAAKNLISGIQRNSARTGSNAASDSHLDMIGKAEASGTITTEEAQFILGLLGV